MFDSVGRTLDPDAGRRRVQTAALTLLLLGNTICGGFAFLSWQAGRVAQLVPVVDEDMVQIEMLDDAPVELIAPVAPSPAPARQQGGLADDVAPPVAPTAEALHDDVAPLDETVATEVTSQRGDPDGDPNRFGTADGDGAGGSGDGAGPRVFHHSELKLKRQVTPVYPEAARDLELGDVSCRVRVFVDSEGIPYDLAFEACPKPFQESSREALQKWRWYPAKMGGERVPAQFVMVFKYTLE